MHSPIPFLALSALSCSIASGQLAPIYEIGDPTPTGSVSVGGVSDAQQAVGTTGGGVFLFYGGQTLTLTIPGETQSANGEDISAGGLIVGSFSRPPPDNTLRGFTINANTLAFTTLAGPPVGDPSGVLALAVSDDGRQILGEARNFTEGAIGHTRRPIRWTDSGAPAQDYGSSDLLFTNIADINNSGQAVGTARFNVQPVVWRGFARLGSEWTDIGGLGGTRTDARAINNNGVVTGNARLPNNSNRAFIWDPITREMEALNPPFDLCSSVGHDINDAGTVVGSGSCSGASTALYWRAGESVGRKLYDLIPPNSGWSRLTSATAIDGCGVVVGQGTREDRPGYSSGYMLVLPEYDTDGDGIPDCWEREGVDIDRDGTVDLDLPSMGADPMRKDLFVEIDAMTGRAPSPATISRVVTSFANAPVSNPNGSTGITLHALIDETGLTRRAYPGAFTEFNADKTEHFGTVAERSGGNAARALEAKRLVFRYCIFADTYSGSKSSGRAETGGNDLMVTLGAWIPAGGTPDMQAGTFMHEFGHTIGLMHGGGDDKNYKPNYYSVMNYAWQTPKRGRTGSWRLDYSRVQLQTLDEGFLDESTGLGGAPGSLPSVLIPYRATDGTAWVSRSTGPEAFDWNNDRVLTPGTVASDLNRFPSTAPPSPGETLTGHDDWANLVYGFRLSPSFRDGVHETVDEMTFDEHEAVQSETVLGVCVADFAEPYGVLDPADVTAFIDAFIAGLTAADLTGPDGLHDLADLTVFVASYAGGCP